VRVAGDAAQPPGIDRFHLSAPRPDKPSVLSAIMWGHYAVGVVTPRQSRRRGVAPRWRPLRALTRVFVESFSQITDSDTSYFSYNTHPKSDTASGPLARRARRFSGWGGMPGCERICTGTYGLRLSAVACMVCRPVNGAVEESAKMTSKGCLIFGPNNVREVLISSGVSRCVELSPLLKGLFCSEVTFEVKQ
jgi:hypothetical protein